jgi:FixJ family two-component response regulator
MTAPNLPSSSPLGPSGSLAPAVIAVVDDDGAIRVALSSLLRSMGHQVRLFATAEAFLADDTMPPADCVLTDVQMPGMSGLELQATLRRRMPLLPVVVITAFPNEAVRQRALAAGALDFLNKPVAADTVSRCIQRALERRRNAP